MGQSYGGLVVALAAGRRPEGVRSLTLIEPAMFTLVMEDEVVQNYLSRLAAVFTAAAQLSSEGFWVRFAQAGGSTVTEAPAFSERDRRAVRATMGERPFWEAGPDLEVLATSAYPKLVCTGGRAKATATVRTLGGRAWGMAASSVADAIGAELVTFENSAHNPQLEAPEPFNATLLKFWRRAERMVP